MNPIFILLAVLLGFYLGRFDQVNNIIKEKIEERKEKKQYKPSVISVDEADLEREMKKEEKERIDISEIV